MRGIFAAGVLDQFLDQGFDPFQLYIGASAGACALASHLARQPGRNHRIFTDYSCRPEFISFTRFLTGGHLIDLDWLWEITIREIRLDLDAITSHPGSFLITLTAVDTGKALYLQPTREDLEDLLKASSAVPHLYRGFPTVRGLAVTDGGVADSIPVAEAHRRGATRIMVIRSNPASYVRRPGLASKVSSWALKPHPGVAAAVRNRAASYNETLRFIEHPPEGLEILQVAPPDDNGVRRLTRDREVLEHAYQSGRIAGQQAARDWQGGTAS
jgi:predicted patatin/cPLA2 family phospholipase